MQEKNKNWTESFVLQNIAERKVGPVVIPLTISEVGQISTEQQESFPCSARHQAAWEGR